MAPKSKDKDAKKVVIVRKKVAGHGGHHGGSWKVAYADFVTAMMALFLVLWIVAMNDAGTKEDIAGYFQNPVGFKDKPGAGAHPIGRSASPFTITQLVRAAQMEERRRFEEVAKQVRTMVLNTPALKALGAQIEVTVGTHGLRIELVDAGGDKDFFARGSAAPQPVTLVAMKTIGGQLRDLENPMIIEGHTDAANYSTVRGYSNWELSADRANAARRALMAEGIADARLSEVRGYAARQLRMPTDPLAAANRRISILVPFTTTFDTTALLRRRAVKNGLGEPVFLDGPGRVRPVRPPAVPPTVVPQPGASPRPTSGPANPPVGDATGSRPTGTAPAITAPPAPTSATAPTADPAPAVSSRGATTVGN